MNLICRLPLGGTARCLAGAARAKLAKSGHLHAQVDPFVAIVRSFTAQIQSTRMRSRRVKMRATRGRMRAG